MRHGFGCFAGVIAGLFAGRRGRSLGPQLAALSLSAASTVRASTAGTVVGALLGLTPGSAVTLVNTAGGRFALSGTNLIVGATAL